MEPSSELGSYKSTKTERSEGTMVLFEYTFYIDKDKAEEYSKWVKEEGIPHWLAVPGFKEIRAYREMGTGRVLAELEFESFEAWGKAMDDPKTKEVSSKFAYYTNGMEWNLWDASRVIPKPLKPSK